MQFTQLEFPIFLILVVLSVWACRTVQSRNLLLLVASYYFYAYWDYRFCALLAFSTVSDYFIAQRIAKQPRDSFLSPRRLLFLSVAINLGVLGFFKYFNFFIDSAASLVIYLGWNASTLDVILPVGISFYTFQTMSYTIDVYRGKLVPSSRFIDFALFVSFFPQLVAGPIVRARELLPQLASQPEWSSRRFYGGFQQLLRGAVKKVLIADRLGEMSDVVFSGPELYSGSTLAIAALAYTGQIYYDFSGYSDMAIGAAKMLGYRFPINFRHPYLATSLSEFWHRWHITLSRWLRDYLYIPLGGNRCSRLASYRNLVVTMTLGGLWHGAAWTFIAWGLLHGVGLVVERSIPRSLSSRVPLWGRWMATMAVVCVGWILFRSRSIDDAWLFLHRMLTASDGIDWIPPLVVLALFCLVAEHLAWQTRLRLAMRLPAGRWYSPVATTIMLWALVLYAPQGFRPFVYFQF